MFHFVVNHEKHQLNLVLSAILMCKGINLPRILGTVFEMIYIIAITGKGNCFPLSHISRKPRRLWRNTIEYQVSTICG